MSQPSSMNRIRWYVDPAMDAPELRSPQPCPRGIACDYKRKNEAGVLEKAWCKFVHPGEEGSGRSIWQEKRLEDGSILPAVVRLSGMKGAVGGGWVQRLKERLPWPDWAAKHGLKADTSAGPLEIMRIGGSRGSTALSPLNPARISQGSQGSQGSQSYHRPQRIDLGSGSTMTAYAPVNATVCASVLTAPSQFPPMAPPRLNLMSDYERQVQAGFRGPIAEPAGLMPCLQASSAATVAVAAAAAYYGAQRLSSTAEQSLPTGEYEDGCATPCLLTPAKQDGDFEGLS